MLSIVIALLDGKLFNMRLRLILHNLRSAHNVGAIIRTADAAGVEEVIFTGITPHPPTAADTRPPYVADKAARDIAKTALGAHLTMSIRYLASLAEAIELQHKHNYSVVALEQAETAENLLEQSLLGNTTLVLGNEVTGLDEAELALCDDIWQIPMRGHKESLNVAAAAAVACYSLLRS